MSSDEVLLLTYNFYASLKLQLLNKAVKDHGRSTYFVCVIFLSYAMENNAIESMELFIPLSSRLCTQII
jgi:hypothetical protein